MTITAPSSEQKVTTAVFCSSWKDGGTQLKATGREGRVTHWYALDLINNAAISVSCEKETSSIIRNWWQAKGRQGPQMIHMRLGVGHIPFHMPFLTILSEPSHLQYHRR